MRKDLVISGFVMQNSGRITNCYTELKLNGKKKKIYGFCRKNNSKILNSYSNAKIKKKGCFGFTGYDEHAVNAVLEADQADRVGNNDKTANYSESDHDTAHKENLQTSLQRNQAGFTIEQQLQLSNGNFFNQDKVKKRSAGVVPDPYSIYQEEITDEYLRTLGWDIESIWNTIPDFPAFNKKDNHFYYDVKEEWLTQTTEESEEDKIIYLESDKDLINLAKKVNDGDKIAASAHYELKNNIDMRGKKWIPLGADIQTPFSGIFDGAGFKIYNYVISDKKLRYTGFFGVIQSAVIANLQLDGVIKKGENPGGFVSYNNQSCISCCNLEVKMKNKKSAGFVHINDGIIDRCHVKGVIDLPFIIWAFWGGAAGITLLAVPLLFVHVPTEVPTFAPISPDEHLEQTETEDLDSDADHNITLKFKKEVKAETGLSLAELYVASPNTQASEYMVVTLQVTDQVLLDTIGSTGRTEKEKSTLANLDSYDPELYRVQVAQSGAIPPGYQIEQLQLTALPDGTVLPAGTYDAVLLFEYYDLENNQKTSLNSQTSVVLTIGEADE